MRTPRSTFRNVALALASTAICIALGEGFLRVFAPTATQLFEVQSYLDTQKGKFCQYHATLGWIGRPNVEDVFEVMDCRHHVRQNRYGFRGSEYKFERSPRPRLVVLGDSFVWGFGVEDDQMFTSIVERQSKPATEIVNLGVSSYGTDQEFLLWEELGRRFQPDRVLLVITPITDLWDNRRHMITGGYPKPVFQPDGEGGYILTNSPVPRPDESVWSAGRMEHRKYREPHWLVQVARRSALTGSALLALSRNSDIRKTLESRRILPERSGAYQGEQSFFTEPPTPAMQESWELMFAILDRLVDATRGEGAELSVAVVPSVVQVYPEHWKDFQQKNPQQEGVEWDREAPNRRIAAFCRARGIQLIELLPALREAAKSDPYLYFPWNRHWTSEGNRLVAEVLLRELSLRP